MVSKCMIKVISELTQAQGSYKASNVVINILIPIRMLLWGPQVHAKNKKYNHADQKLWGMKPRSLKLKKREISNRFE